MKFVSGLGVIGAGGEVCICPLPVWALRVYISFGPDALRPQVHHSYKSSRLTTFYDPPLLAARTTMPSIFSLPSFSLSSLSLRSNKVCTSSTLHKMKLIMLSPS